LGLSQLLATQYDAKASLVIGGARIIERQLAALLPLAGDIRIIANDPDRYGDLGVPVTADAVRGVGPIGGLYTALLEARYDRVIVLACDMPFVPADALRRLVEASVRAGADATVPRSAAGLEPLCAVYGKHVAAIVERGMAAGERQLQGLLARLRVREVAAEALAPDDRGMLLANVNTPHDYARARDLFELDQKPSEDPITE
jgi:molybdopterin-guanine dinucleotide biosynthesis protein A